MPGPFALDPPVEMSSPVEPPRAPGRDVTQLTLPQIARAVVAGEIPLAVAEAELRRRPSDPARRLRPPPPRPIAPTQATVLAAIEATRRELRQASKRLADLTKRLDTLAAEAARATPPAPVQRRKLGGNQRPSSRRRDEEAA